MKTIKYLSLLSIIIFAASGCYYDNVEELHPGVTDKSCADTAGVVAFNPKVKTIIDANCGTTGGSAAGCHGASSSSGIPLETYADMQVALTDYPFMDDIRQTPDAGSVMPKGGGKLSDCQTQVIQNWIDQGQLEN